MSDPAAIIPSRKALQPTVIALGFVSLLMDASSEMVHALLPVFLVGTLGAAVAAIGVIEGIAPSSFPARCRIGSGDGNPSCCWAMRREPSG
jgi:hypothetical protein